MTALARSRALRPARSAPVTRAAARTDAGRRACAGLASLYDVTEDDAAWRRDEIVRRALAACRAIRDAQTRSQELTALAHACAVADDAE